jgi:hypothetical protein
MSVAPVGQRRGENGLIDDRRGSAAHRGAVERAPGGPDDGTSADASYDASIERVSVHQWRVGRMPRLFHRNRDRPDERIPAHAKLAAVAAAGDRDGEILLRRSRGRDVHRHVHDVLLGVDEYRSLWEQRLDRLEDYLRDLQAKEKKHGRKKK